MNEISHVLDELVSDAPLEKASWADVRARSRRMPLRARRFFRGRSRIAVSLAGGLALLVLSGVAVALEIGLLGQQEQFHANRPDDPGAVGPFVEITSGSEWALIAWNSKVGLCVDFAIPGNSPFSCDFPVRGAKAADSTSGAGAPIHAVAGFVSGAGLVGGDGKTTIFGVAAREVAAVEIELRDGRLVAAELYDAPAELNREVQFFITRLSLPPQRGKNPVRSFRALDSEGRLIETVG